MSIQRDHVANLKHQARKRPQVSPTPTACPRCKQMFPSASQAHAHARTCTPGNIREPNPTPLG